MIARAGVIGVLMSAWTGFGIWVGLVEIDSPTLVVAVVFGAVAAGVAISEMFR